MTTFDQSPIQHKSTFERCRPGNVACPKCFGETELVLTNRDEQGWPLGPLKRVTCNFCDGEGEVSADKAATAPKLDPDGFRYPAEDETWYALPPKSETSLPNVGTWGTPTPKDKWGR